MPDWVRYVREHLSLRDCPPDREAEIVEELAQQLDDAYQEELQSGLNEQHALRFATRHISDWPALANDIKDAGITHARRGRTKRPATKDLFDQHPLLTRTSTAEIGTPREGRMEASSKV